MIPVPKSAVFRPVCDRRLSSRAMGTRTRRHDRAKRAGAQERIAAKIENSSVYQEFLAEREEILRLKWLESEREEHDIGFDAALLIWILRHRDDWRTMRRASCA